MKQVVWLCLSCIVGSSLSVQFYLILMQTNLNVSFTEQEVSSPTFALLIATDLISLPHLSSHLPKGDLILQCFNCKQLMGLRLKFKIIHQMNPKKCNVTILIFSCYSYCHRHGNSLNGLAYEYELQISFSQQPYTIYSDERQFLQWNHYHPTLIIAQKDF